MDTKKLRQKILDLAIRGKLVPQDPNDESASVLLERIRAEKERLIAEGKIKRPKKSKASSAESHYQNFTPPFEAPAYWGWCKIDDVAFVTKLAGFEYSKYIADNLSSEFGIPLFKGKNVKNGAIDYTFESFIPEPISDELWRSQITKKCLLTPYVGAIGNVGIHHKTGKFHLGSNVGKIEIFNEHESLYSEEYLRYYLLSTYGYKELTKHKKATAQESISIDAIRDVIIPVVGIDEQFRIVSEIEKWGKFLDNIDNGILQLTDYISLAKSKILDLAMQGKLVPQDPTDEPAADMLRRINPKAKIITDNPHYPRWVSTQLGEVCDFERGITFPSVAKEHTKTINNIACLRTANIHDEVDLTSLWFIDKSFLRGNSNKLIRLGDIIMSTANSRELVGRSVIIKTCEEEMTFGGFVTAIRTSVLSPAFLQLFLKYKT
ncbi:restriction endonuclease subunit S, partial [uncultured Duncaniella sp.]|uniref:restriction endonuclease subunit S n=1 Tax=uncultured Duncaniella sp. TaxID=2768039 RepID=UPI0025A2FB1F